MPRARHNLARTAQTTSQTTKPIQATVKQSATPTTRTLHTRCSRCWVRAGKRVAVAVSIVILLFQLFHLSIIIGALEQRKQRGSSRLQGSTTRDLTIVKTGKYA